MLEMGRRKRFRTIWIDSDTFGKIRFLTLANPSSRAQKFGFGSSGNRNSEILKVPKMLRKLHFWIAELRSFKMRSKSAFFVGRIAISRPFRVRKLAENGRMRTQL